MHKLRLVPILVLIALTTVIIGCTRAASSPDTGQLSTLVASTLAARPTQEPSPTATELPTSTPLILPSSTPTEPAGPTASPTATELPFDDPREGRHLDPADYHDDFDPPLDWYTFSNSDATIPEEDGQLSATDHRADFLVWWSISDQAGDDSYVEVTSRFGTCDGKDAAGLSMRVIGNRGYVVEFACDASFRVRKFAGGGNPVVLKDWTTSQFIHGGSQAINRLGVLAEGEEIWVFANGHPLTEDPLADDDYQAGLFALFASAAETPGFTVLFDKFEHWDLSP
jgi:hypothetical protein